MTTGNSEHVAKGSLDPEDPTKYSDNPTENSGNHEETLLSRVESSLANQAVRDSERDVQQTPEDKEDTHTVAELLEILERGGDSSYQLTSHAAHQLIDAGDGGYVAGYLYKFTNLDASVAHQLIDTGYGWYVARYLDKFTNLDASVAHQLIDTGNGEGVARRLNNFTGLNHSEIAQKLIDAGNGGAVVRNLNNFTGLNHSEIAQKLIDAGNGGYVAGYLNNFTGLNHSEIAHQLIDAGNGREVAEYLDNFTSLNHSEIAQKLIDAGDGRAVARNLNKFTNLDASVAHQLIDAGDGREVARYLYKFTNLDASVAHKLIDTGNGRAVVGYFNNFTGLDASVAHQLIDTGNGEGVARRLNNFTGLNHSEIAHQLIDTGNGGVLVRYLDNFTGLDASVAHKLIDTGNGGAVVRYLNKFTSLDASVAHQLIDTGNGEGVARRLNKFTGLNHSEIAQKLIDAGDGRAVARNLNKFTNLDASVAHQLIDAGDGGAVVRYLDNFTGLDASVAHQLIDAGDGGAVVRNLNKFTGLNHSEIAHQLIDTGNGGEVVRYLDKFTGLDHNEIAHKLIDAGSGWLIAHNLDKFTGLDASVAHKLIDAGDGGEVVVYLDKFTGLNHSEIAHQLIDAGDGGEVVRYLDNFTGLDASVAHKLIDAGYELQVLQCAHVFGESTSEIVLGCIDKIKLDADVADAVLEHLSDYGMDAAAQCTVLWACANHYSTAQKVAQLDLEGLIGSEEASKLRAHIAELKPDLQGVEKYNPYADEAGDMEHVTSSRPGTKFHERAIQANRRLRSPETEEDRELAETIQQAYDKLRADIASQYGDQYSQEMFGKRGDKLGDIWPAYRRLVADYIAVMDEYGLPEALERAAKAFNQVLRVDTKYYDKLFAEWDAKRIGEKEFQEVFLGRDGVYAYVARRAQLYARRRRLGMSSHAAGGSLMEFPTYLVYPRGFRDELDDVVKDEYLHPRIQNPDAAHYYDTGFTGTIPEDIMRVLGVSESDRDNQIRLLSASDRPRTVLGLKGDKPERDQIVNTIEHHVKDEESAEGLYRTEDGRLEPYSRPTEPDERLAFRMTQLALSRHYYTRELKSTEPVNLGYEVKRLEGQREMRIDGEYSEAVKGRLAELFSSHDIGAELLQSATSLKIANPNDPYPGEAVFELSVGGDTEVIVKNVVKAKQQGPIDEFEALLLLRKLGVDTPKPIARVFTSGQQGFVVMEKINGESGRTIREFFANNAVSEENKRELMTDALSRMRNIAETVRRDTGIDKPWRLKDFIIEYSRDGNDQYHIASMRPIDFERAKVFDPDDPHSIELGQGLDDLVRNTQTK